MAYRNLENLSRSRNQIAEDLGFNINNKVHRIMAKGLFQEAFGLEKLCKSFKKKQKGEIPIGIYYPVKICVKNFEALEKIGEKYQKEEKITSNDVLKYYEGILNDIDLPDKTSYDKTLYGEKLIASMLKNHPSVKYAYIMKRNYNKFLENIALLTSICTEQAITSDPDSFYKMNTYLEETIWLYYLERTIKRTTTDETQFNINKALKDTIHKMDAIHSECETSDMDERLSDLCGATYEEYKRVRDETEKEYFSNAKKLIYTNADKEETDKFYKNADEEKITLTKVIWNFIGFCL